MNKIYISADVEGLNGITSFKQTLPEYRDDYAQMRPQLHFELNALIKGLKKAGVTEIVINDAHNTMTNITLSELPRDVKLISGKPKKVSMMYGLDKSFDGIVFFAYHAKATSQGVLAHTFNINFKSVWLNGEKISEAILNGIYAKYFDVPIVLASGDNIFCDEINEDLNGITTVCTKNVITTTAAICEKNEILEAKYIEAASNIKNNKKCHYKTADNYELKVEFDTELLAQKVAQEVGIISQNNFVIVNTEDYVEIYTTLQRISASITGILKEM